MLERCGGCYERTGEEGLKGGLGVGVNIHMSEITVQGQKGDRCFLGKPIPGPRQDTAGSRPRRSRSLEGGQGAGAHHLSDTQRAWPSLL